MKSFKKRIKNFEKNGRKRKELELKKYHLSKALKYNMRLINLIKLEWVLIFM
jgi:hypothetical protein